MRVDIRRLNFSDLPRFARRVFISKNLSPKKSRFLYKYRSIDADDLSSINRLKEIIINSKLWLSSSKDFNDPFDMSAKIIFGATAQERRKYWYREAKKKHKSKKERDKYVKSVINLPNDISTKLFKINIGGLINNTGVCSFAGDPRNILMWSHYANNHSGICIQFERSVHPEIFLQTVPMNYSLSYPVLNVCSDAEESVVDVMTMKHKGWEYENEERFVAPGKAYYTNPNIFLC